MVESTSQNKENNSNNRRREERIPAKNAKFILEDDGKTFSTKVINLSRLGLGIELSGEVPSSIQDKMIVGATVNGELSLPHGATQVNATIRVRRDMFLGLEYNISSAEFLNHLRTLLSPNYIGSTIRETSHEFLSADTESAYRGDEFECLVFKRSKHSPFDSFQFFAAGRFVEVIDGDARFVPLPLVRQVGGTNDFEYVLEFFEVDETNTKKELKSFFKYLEAILGCWEDCPKAVKNVVNEQISKIK